MSTDVLQAVRESVTEALGVPADQVTPEATLMDELGAESIDLLDILFRVERKTGIKIKSSDISAHVQGGIPEGQFGDESGIITPAALAHLKVIMPQIEVDQLRGRLEAEKAFNLFTVQNLADLVESRASAVTA